MKDFDIAPLDPAQWPQVLDLLARNGLPEAGLAGHLDSVRVAVGAPGIAGCVAIEGHGRFALLRSLAVEAAYRGTGLGRRLTQVALDMAAARGLQEVYLLTETAEGFFQRLDFQAVSRPAVPQEIQETEEFSEACPASATVMRWTPAGGN